MRFKVGLLAASLLAAAWVQAEEATSSASSLKAEIKIGTAVENREATGVAESFETSVEKVVGWTRIEGAVSPVKISHIWIYKGNEIATVSLDVPSSPYRTYSRKTITGFPGSWTFQVKDEAGNLLAEKKFEVVESAGAGVAQ